MFLARYGWALRRRVLGPEVVVTKDRVAALAQSSALGRAGRARARMLLVRELALGPPRRARIATGPVHVELGGEGHDFAIDWKAFAEIFGDHQYATAFEGAHVLDVGGHKGYFGAYAFACGASIVLSYEPARANYAALARAAGPLGDRWLTRNAALGATHGEGTLLLDRTSWAHSLREVDRPAGEQPVSIVTLQEALAELPAGGTRTIVKVDAEGSECEILSRPEGLERIDLLFVEWHPKVATCSADELSRAVAPAGLIRTSESMGLMTFART